MTPTLGLTLYIFNACCCPATVSTMNALPLGIITGQANPCGLWVWVARVRVQVANLPPIKNPYLWHGYRRVSCKFDSIVYFTKYNTCVVNICCQFMSHLFANSPSFARKSDLFQKPLERLECCFLHLAAL